MKKVRPRETYLFSILLDFYVDFLSAGAGGGLHDGADRLGDLAMLADDHAHVILSNTQSEIDGVILFGFQDGDFIGTVNDRLSDLDQGLFQVNHVSSPDP